MTPTRVKGVTPQAWFSRAIPVILMAFGPSSFGGELVLMTD